MYPFKSFSVFTFRKQKIYKQSDIEYINRGVLSLEEEELIEKGKEIFNKLEPSLLGYYPNQYIAIEVESREYFISNTLVQAIKDASTRFPDKEFYTARIGVPKGVIGEFK